MHFGSVSPRFKPKKDEMLPGPADYSPPGVKKGKSNGVLYRHERFKEANAKGGQQPTIFDQAAPIDNPGPGQYDTNTTVSSCNVQVFKSKDPEKKGDYFITSD